MAGNYSCYFFGANGHVVGRADYIADTDEQSITEARKQCAQRQLRRFELWQVARVVYKQPSHSEVSEENAPQTQDAASF